MAIPKDVETQMVAAMKAKDAMRLNALRSMKAAFTSEAITLKADALTDEQALAVIKRLVKQRRDSIEQFRKGNREELAAVEESEMKVLEAFLPAQMSEEEVRKVAESVRARLGVTDKSKIGQFIGAVIKETKGRADGAVVKRIAESLLN